MRLCEFANVSRRLDVRRWRVDDQTGGHRVERSSSRNSRVPRPRQLLAVRLRRLQRFALVIFLKRQHASQRVNNARAQRRLTRIGDNTQACPDCSSDAFISGKVVSVAGGACSCSWKPSNQPRTFESHRRSPFISPFECEPSSETQHSTLPNFSLNKSTSHLAIPSSLLRSKMPKNRRKMVQNARK